MVEIDSSNDQIEMSTRTATNPAAAGKPAEILKDILEHTIFSWSKQSSLNPL